MPEGGREEGTGRGKLATPRSGDAGARLGATTVQAAGLRGISGGRLSLQVQGGSSWNQQSSLQTPLAPSGSHRAEICPLT